MHLCQTCPEPMKRVVNPTSRLIWPEVEVDEDQDQEVDHLENSRKVCLHLVICDGWYDLRRWNLDLRLIMLMFNAM